ncbi:uncharacterized protein LOC143909539 [Arctopsyche grandis]|uniref:uncharacterized protein LOC143909539 n=1 Tax=Arctopsyche grandis TaxID=121162 RepID=UPI00406D6A2A
MAARTRCWRIPTISMLALIFIMFWLSLPESDGSPIWAHPAKTLLKKFEENSQCNEDGDLLEICQRCAKATKSVNAYPMCCADEDNAVKWCKDYLYFGIQ